MKKDFKISVIGGDERNIFAARRLREMGYFTETFALAEGKPYSEFPQTHPQAIVLPLPLTKDGKTLFAPASENPIFISDLLESAPKDALIFGGQTQNFSDERLIDYSQREDFAIWNAIPTAEGAVFLAMQNLRETIRGMRVCVLGFGKVGMQSAKLFQAMGADVSVYARKAEARALADICGYTANDFHALSKYAANYKLLINTVPARIFGNSILSQIKKESLILDLASAPYGLDFNAAKRLGLKAICASGLPGKYFPETAGNAVAQVVENLLLKYF